MPRCSFNASALVSVWGGFSTSWYRQLLHNDQVLDAAWLSLEIGLVVNRDRADLRDDVPRLETRGGRRAVRL